MCGEAAVEKRKQCKKGELVVPSIWYAFQVRVHIGWTSRFRPPHRAECPSLCTTPHSSRSPNILSLRLSFPSAHHARHGRFRNGQPVDQIYNKYVQFRRRPLIIPNHLRKFYNNFLGVDATFSSAKLFLNSVHKDMNNNTRLQLIESGYEHRLLLE